MKKQMLLITLSAMLFVPTVFAAELGQSSPTGSDNSLGVISSINNGKVDQEAHFDYWYPKASLGAKYGSSGTEITDFKDQLGMVNKNAITSKIVLRGDSGKEVRIGYAGINLAGNKTITDDITYNGVVYHTGVVADTKFDFNYLSVDLKRNVVEKGKTSFGMLYGIKLLSINAAITGDATVNGVPVSSRREENKLTAPVPTIGFIATQKIGEKGRLSGEISGLSLGRYGYIYDAEVSYQHRIGNNTEAGVGYRVLDIRGNNGDDYAKIKLSGPYVGLKMIF